MSLTVNSEQAHSLLTKSIRAGLVPMFQGSPGCGKSALVHQIGKEYNLYVIDVRLAQCDPTDLLGFPHIDKDAQKASYVPMNTFPIEGDPIPEGYDGFLLFLDEFNSADRGVQKAAYKLVLDRMIGQFNLHEYCAIICAGNLDTDNAIVEEMSTALQSRLVHFELAVDHQVWIRWATSNDIDHRITAFVNFKPSLLYNFKPDHTDKTYASPRTWEFANKFLQVMNVDDPLLLQALAGTVGEGVAREFLGFLRIYEDLPQIEDIIKSPQVIPVPKDEGILYALSGAIAHNADKTNIDQLIQYVERMRPEYQVVCLKEAIRRCPEINRSPALAKWKSENTNAFLG